MQMDFGQASRNKYICIIPGNLSDAWLFSNLCWQVLKSIKSRGQICPILLRRKRTFPCGLENHHACKWILDNFQAWSLSNPCGKVLIIVGMLWSPDLKVQHITTFTQYPVSPNIFGLSSIYKVLLKRYKNLIIIYLKEKRALARDRIL